MPFRSAHQATGGTLEVGVPLSPACSTVSASTGSCPEAATTTSARSGQISAGPFLAEQIDAVRYGQAKLWVALDPPPTGNPGATVRMSRLISPARQASRCAGSSATWAGRARVRSIPARSRSAAGPTQDHCCVCRSHRLLPHRLLRFTRRSALVRAASSPVAAGLCRPPGGLLTSSTDNGVRRTMFGTSGCRSPTDQESRSIGHRAEVRVTTMNTDQIDATHDIGG